MRRLVAVATALLITACAPAPSGEPSVRTPEGLREVETGVTLGNATLTLEVEAWRSFQPTVGQEAGDPLIAIIRVRVSEGGRLPGALALNSVYLVHDNEVFQATAREEQPRSDDAEMVEFVLRDGPRWATGDSIDVIVGLAGLGAPVTLLRAPTAVIARVD